MVTMAILTAITPSAYSIEYQFYPINNEMMKDEAISAIPELRTISYNEKFEFLAPHLKSSDNLPSKLYINNSQEPEKESSLLIWEENTIPKSDIKAEKTTLVLKEKHGLEAAEGYSSPKKKNDRDQQDNKPVDDIFKYSIQVYSSSYKTNADNLVQQMKKENYESFSFKIYNPLTKKTHYRVFIGRYNDLQSAKNACELLKKNDEFSDNIFVVNQRWVTGG